MQVAPYTQASLLSDTNMAEASADEVEECPAELAAEEQATRKLLPVKATAAQPLAPAKTTAWESDESGPGASRLDLKAHDNVTNILPQLAGEPNHVPCICNTFDNMKDDVMGSDSSDEREVCGNGDIKAPSHTPGMEAPSLIAKQHHEKLGQVVLPTEAEERHGVHAATDLSEVWGRTSPHSRSLPPTG